MSAKALTDADLLVLGLLAEMPRHGYELEQVIDDRGMREWTEIGFSSIYFVLNKLERQKLVKAGKTSGAKARKRYSLTEPGTKAVKAQSLKALGEFRAVRSSVLLGMIHWPLLDQPVALHALGMRGKAIDDERARLEQLHLSGQPLPDHVDALFEYSLGQLSAEAKWVAATIACMERRPELG
jgi:DNA-binding PadR family transcriptional regulator